MGWNHQPESSSAPFAQLELYKNRLSDVSAQVGGLRVWPKNSDLPKVWGFLGNVEASLIQIIHL